MMKYCFFLFTALLLYTSSFAQKEDIEVFEKKDGNKNIVVARNTGKISYLVSLIIDSKGMDVSPSINVEAVIPGGYMKEMASLVPRPGEAWTYSYEISFQEYTGQEVKSSATPAAKSNTNAAAAAIAPVTAPPTALSTAPIIVYTQVGCGRCSAVKKEMKAKGIAFEEIDVNSGSPEVNNMWKQLRDGGFTGENVTMPVVKVDGKLHYNIKDLTGFVSGLVK